MDFTEVYKQTAGLVLFSPGTTWLLTAVHDRLVVRRSDSFEITRSWQLGAQSLSSSQLGKSETAAANKPAATAGTAGCMITHAGWSSDSEFLFAASAKNGFVEVFKLMDESWNARIECGAEGLVKVEWAPDGRSILCFSEWGLRVTVWSLVTGTATYIQFPIHPDRGYAFTDNGRFFVLAERHKSKDTLGIYDAAESYRLTRHFPLPSASLASISLSPTGTHLAVWEGPLEYKLYVLTIAGELLGTFSPEPDRGLGIRCVTWHPSGSLLLVAGYDDKIYVLENLTWNPVAVLELQSRVPSGVAIWREPSNWLEATQGRGFLSYERLLSPHTLQISRPELSKAYPRCGTVQLAFNTSGTLLLARFESTPHAIHLFTFHSGALPHLRSVLLHTQPVVSAQWNPSRKGVFAACCGEECVYMWSDEWEEDGADEAEEMAECVGVPAVNFAIRDIRWAPDGKGMVLLAKDTFCCAFEVDEDGPMED